ncbi:MAG TPA: BLUF domain-containing protein, partial [Leptospiraceae bacterium]|nr:BLUF domain-containing protein [Leptospiraceae bacterium]
MKRLTYISNFSQPLARNEIERIGEVSVRNNARDGLTGALFCFHDVFYQVIEGEEQAIERCYSRILKDSRHK